MNTTKSSEENDDKEADAEDDKRCKAAYILMRQQIQATSSARSRRARRATCVSSATGRNITVEVRLVLFLGNPPARPAVLC